MRVLPTVTAYFQGCLWLDEDVRRFDLNACVSFEYVLKKARVTRFVSTTHLLFYRADLPRLCKYFNLDYRECSKVLTPDSRGHVALPDLIHLAVRDNYTKTSNTYWGRVQSPNQRSMVYHHPPSRGNIPPSILHAPAIAFDTEGSFSPPPEHFTTEEGVSNPFMTRPPSHSAPDSRVSCILVQTCVSRSLDV